MRLAGAPSLSCASLGIREPRRRRCRGVRGEQPGLPRLQDAGPRLGCLYSQRIILARGPPQALTTRYWLVTVCGSGLLLVQVTVLPTKTVSRWSEMLEQVPPV